MARFIYRVVVYNDQRYVLLEDVVGVVQDAADQYAAVEGQLPQSVAYVLKHMAAALASWEDQELIYVPDTPAELFDEPKDRVTAHLDRLPDDLGWRPSPIGALAWLGRAWDRVFGP